jgi:tetratricopeptide (TPR) repeat protein
MKTSMILKITITALVTLGLSSSPAMAADPYTEPAPAATTESKTNKKTKAKDSVESLLKSSRSSISKKKWAQAKKDLIKADKLNSKNADVKNLLGFVTRNMNDTKSSMKYYQAALKIDPNHLGANEYLGELYLKLKQPAKANAQLAKLEQICGTNCAEYKDLAQDIAKYKK